MLNLCCVCVCVCVVFVLFITIAISIITMVIVVIIAGFLCQGCFQAWRRGAAFAFQDAFHAKAAIESPRLKDLSSKPESSKPRP